ncbi:MAG TPA: S8 family serine peptidase [Clostridia bacterium]|nr:S8 family serine peptidase [Clostridia bacterium]HQM39633.1 S8 family serine peptidase [Clostridia bacterium]
MKNSVKNIAVWLLIITLCFSFISVKAQDEAFDTRYYWLYSSAIPAAWKLLADIPTTEVTVAVIDTGIEFDNPHLKERIDLRGHNFVPSASVNDVNDKEGHGTAVAGIIAAIPSDNMNYYGVCGNIDVKILPLKVYSDLTGALQIQYIIDAIYYAIEMDVDVINISIDIPHYDEGLQIACLAAYENSIPIIASAGNKGNEYYSYPSSCYGVISVSALSLYNNDYFLSSPFSSYNDRIDLSAHGEDIYTIGLDGTYKFLSGSSFSCAIVTGAVAVLKAVDKDLTPLEIETILCSSADKLTDEGRNNYYGYGKLNLFSALTLNVDSLIFQSEEQKPSEDTPAFSFSYQNHKNLLSCGLSYGLWLEKNNKVSSAGDSSFGKTDVTQWDNIISVATGDSFSLGLKSDGTLQYTGFSGSYALNVAHWSSIKQVSAGAFHTVAVTNVGTVLATGSNSAGQCNTGIIAGVSTAECGSMHTVCLRSNGTVRSVGTNFFGECNTSNWTDIVSISAGNGFTLGLKSDGTVVGTGNNRFKQIDVSTWNNIIEVFAGYNYSIGLKADGTLVYTGLATKMSSVLPELSNIKTLSCNRDMMILKTNDDEIIVIGNIHTQERTTNKIYVFNFDDVSQDYWAAPYINIVSRLGIINGVYNGTGYIYVPYVHMTRQEFFKIIIETLGVPTSNIEISLEVFKDYQDVASWSLPYIKTAYYYGYLTGNVDSNGDLYIKPTDPISRAEAATIMSRAFGLSQSPDMEYSDKDSIPFWAYEAMSYFSYLKVLNGYPDNTIAPNANLYRSEAAAIICRLYSYVLNTYTFNYASNTD